MMDWRLFVTKCVKLSRIILSDSHTKSIYKIIIIFEYFKRGRLPNLRGHGVGFVGGLEAAGLVGLGGHDELQGAAFKQVGVRQVHL